MKYFRNVKLIAWITLSLCTAYSVYFLATYVVNARTPAIPMIDAPTLLEWDKVEVYGAVKNEILIKNQGRAELRIYDIRSTCGCLGLEKMEDGQLTSIKEINLKPGEKFIAVFRMEARANAGSKIRQRISFSTNDPHHSIFHIDGVIHEVTGGVTGIPSSIYAGALLPGGVVENTFDIIDGAELPRKLEKLEVSDPSHEVILVSTERKEILVNGKRTGSLIGRGKVKTVAPQHPGAFHYKIHVYLANSVRRPDEMEVSGMVKSPVTFLPSVIVLPKSSTTGDVYSQSITITNITDQPCHFQVVEKLSGIHCDLPPSLKAGETALVRVYSEPAELQGNITGKINIHVRWSKGKYLQPISYRVTKP